MKQTVADILGPWVEPGSESSLIDRCRGAWNKPLEDLNNVELATLLEQRFAVEHILPIAKTRLEQHIDDETEFYDGHLQAVVDALKGK